MMPRLVRQVTCVLAFFALSTSGFAAESPAGAPEALLRKADAIRNPGESYEMRIQVKTPDSEQEFQVYLKGTDKTLIVTRSPARDLGRNMLMLDRDFYAYVPNLKRSIRLSLAQKLTGQVANGDIARTRWAGDYRATREGTAPSKAREVRLLLEGNKPNLTYQKIRLWLEAGSSRPLRAEYLSLDGQTVLKRASFEAYKQLDGRERPTLIRIEDTNHLKSSIEIVGMHTRMLDDSFFTERNMESLR